ncbi:tRNA(Met) cytidine acetyltransferase TmcA [Bacillus sp. T2.9-1]|uniref:GNAT family N-acetyltransferase n=1 Tax=Bacillus sp. T2.9-1 TaxID=3041163 RepID=UPI0024779A7A|nr:GNAT family N-acetyltransferase [Bacillus sp. T2.9-1]CAI9389101.1 tRNA(Met) cytidine acetyltransferase TmcA [Bacillus sp. T2.9-1]
MLIRNVQPSDLPPLLEIENIAFTSAEAATKKAFINRMETIPDTFIIMEENGVVIGYVNGPVISKAFITDDLFERTVPNPPKGGHQSILGIAVHPNYQRKGIASILLKKLEKIAAKGERLSITLTCRKELIPFYEKNGYQNQGIADSHHAGVQWFNMIKQLKK